MRPIIFLLCALVFTQTANASCLRNKNITAARNAADTRLSTAILKNKAKAASYERIRVAAAEACYVEAKPTDKECQKVKFAYSKKGHKPIVLCRIHWTPANLVAQMLLWNIRPTAATMKAALKIYQEIYQANN